MGRKKTAVQKAPRSQWHEHTAEKDIRYRGPLNYQHFQLLGWLCIVFSQVGLILSIGERLGQLPESFAGLTEPVTFLSFLSLPFLLIANFAQIMNGQKSYRFLLLKNFGAAAAIFVLYAFVLHRYLLGTIDILNDGTVSSMDVLLKIMQDVAPDGVLCFNIFIDLFLCTLVMFFLNYNPRRIFTGKCRFIFRMFALLPIVYEVGSIVLKVLAYRKLVTISPFLYPLFAVKPPMTFVLFIILAVYIKTRELRFRRHGKTHEQYKAFLNTKKNSWDFSLFLSIALVVISLADIIVYFLTSIMEVNILQLPKETASSYHPIALVMGFGDSIPLFFLAPLVLLFSYTREPRNKMMSTLIPVASFAMILMLYVEAFHQAIPMFGLPKINMQVVTDPSYVPEGLSENGSDMTLEELMEIYPELREMMGEEALSGDTPSEDVPAEDAPAEEGPAEIAPVREGE